VGRPRLLARCVRSAVFHVLKRSVIFQVYLRDRLIARTRSLPWLFQFSRFKLHGFFHDQMIHDELPPGWGVLAHIELEQRLNHVTVIDADLG
jgi:hypothetical protein